MAMSLKAGILARLRSALKSNREAGANRVETAKAVQEALKPAADELEIQLAQALASPPLPSNPLPPRISHVLQSGYDGRDRRPGWYLGTELPGPWRYHCYENELRFRMGREVRLG